MTHSAKFGTAKKPLQFGVTDAKTPAQRPSKTRATPLQSHIEDSAALYQKLSQEISAENIKKEKTPKQARKANWAFFMACLYTFFGAQLLMVPYTLWAEGFADFTQHMTDNFMTSIIMARYIFILGFIAKFLGKISNRMDMPPRDSYIINGFLLSLIMAVGELATGNAIQPLSYCFFIAGGFGGYMFWHSRGCPKKA